MLPQLLALYTRFAVDVAGFATAAACVALFPHQSWWQSNPNTTEATTTVHISDRAYTGQIVPTQKYLILRLAATLFLLGSSTSFSSLVAPRACTVQALRGCCMLLVLLLPALQCPHIGLGVKATQRLYGHVGEQQADQKRSSRGSHRRQSRGM